MARGRSGARSNLRTIVLLIGDGPGVAGLERVHPTRVAEDSLMWKCIGAAAKRRAEDVSSRGLMDSMSPDLRRRDFTRCSAHAATCLRGRKRPGPSHQNLTLSEGSNRSFREVFGRM